MNLAKLFQPNHIKVRVVVKSSMHQHSWGNAHLEVDHEREMVQMVDECVYGCGSRREADIRDLSWRGKRCS